MERNFETDFSNTAATYIATNASKINEYADYLSISALGMVGGRMWEITLYDL